MLKLKHLAWSLMAMAAAQVTAVSAVQAQAAVARDASSYFIVTHADLRKCAFPMCGGYFVRSVNQILTRCADGTFKRECHAATLNTAALGWTDEQTAAFGESFGKTQALVRGTLATGTVQSVKADVLTVKEAWQGQALSKPLGTFYGVKSTGIVCITAPCPSLAATVLNSTAQPTTPDLDLSKTDASDKQIEAAGQALYDTGILTVGTIVPVRYTDYAGKARRGNKLVATEFYLPAKP